MKRSLLSKVFVTFTVISAMIGGFYYIRPKQNYRFEFPIDEADYRNFTHSLQHGQGLTRAHAVHFYEVFLDILLNKYNRFDSHAENVHLLNYILRNDAKWRVTESAIFNMLDVTGNQYINKLEFETFTHLFSRVGDRRLIENFISVIDRNIDTKIMKHEWFSFCNKNLRPKMLQDLQKWETDTGHYLPNPQRIVAQFTALDKKERNHRDLIHGQLDRALKMMNEDFQMFIDHFENHTPHSIDDPDMFVRRMGYWILNRFERWDVVYMWLYQMLDDNGDGLLTQAEAKAQFDVFLVPIIHAKELFQSLDEDRNGILERDEWSDWSETIRKLLVSHFKESEPRMSEYE